MSEKINKLPPIIVDYIEKLSAKNSSSFHREMYCQILEGVRDACDKAIRDYKVQVEERKKYR